MKIFNINSFNSKFNKIWYYLLITSVSIFVCYPLFKRGYYFISHEHFFSLYRTYGVTEAIRNGQFPAKVLPNLVNGMGYGWSIFYSPLVYDLSALFNLLGLSVLASVKLTHILGVFLSGILMYTFMNRVSKSSIVAITASLLYLTAPYRLVDLYVRDAFAESFSFAILPIIFLGLYEVIYGNKNRWWILGMGIGIMILTHNITAIYSILLIITYLTLNLKSEYRDKVFLFTCCKAVVLALLLSSYYLLPFLGHKYYGDYAVFSEKFQLNFGSTSESVHQHSVKFLQFFKHDFSYNGSRRLDENDNDEMPYLIGFPILFFSIIGYFAINTRKFFFDYCFWSAVFLVLVMMPFFPWNLMPKVFLYIQFPWRLLLFVSFLLSAVGGFALIHVAGSWRQLACITCLTLLFCIYIYPFIHPDYKEATPSEVAGVENISNSNLVGYSVGEYLPTSIKIDYIKQRSKNINILEGKATIDVLKESGLKVRFFIKPETEKVTLELPLVYYFGYQAKLRKPDGTKYYLDVSEGPNGLLTLQLQEKGVVTIWYGQTKLSIVGNILTLIGILWCIYLIGKNNISKELHNKERAFQGDTH